MLEGHGQYLLTVLLSILFNYLPWANDTTPALLLMWCGKPAKWLTWACIALYRTVNSLIQIWFHHFFTSLELIHFIFRPWLVVPAIKKDVTFSFKSISDFRYLYVHMDYFSLPGKSFENLSFFAHWHTAEKHLKPSQNKEVQTFFYLHHFWFLFLSYQL